MSEPVYSFFAGGRRGGMGTKAVATWVRVCAYALAMMLMIIASMKTSQVSTAWGQFASSQTRYSALAVTYESTPSETRDAEMANQYHQAREDVDRAFLAIGRANRGLNLVSLLALGMLMVAGAAEAWQEGLIGSGSGRKRASLVTALVVLAGSALIAWIGTSLGVF